LKLIQDRCHLGKSPFRGVSRINFARRYRISTDSYRSDADDVSAGVISGKNNVSQDIRAG